MNITELEGWIGRDAVDPSGSKVGTLADVYLDDATGDPEWLAVLTGWFGSRISFVPLRGASLQGDDVALGYEKDLVKDAPRMEADGTLSVEEEEVLYRYYGLEYAPQVADSGDEPQDMQETGSTTFSAEVSPEVAVARLRRAEDEAVRSIGFDLYEDEPRDGAIEASDVSDRPTSSS